MMFGKLLIIRLAGGVIIAIGLAGLFLFLNPATTHKLSPFALLYDLTALGVGFGMVFSRKWAAGAFVILATFASALIIRESLRPDVSRWIYLNLFLLAVPVWACLTAWRTLK
jgi:uncharacterized membrane protein YccC